ncbi:uncharacterized protein BDV14DRAFT_171098 [Aspergillus stella-maris]|uniref:uncharacterized protein n=1 Tax=Aspergillus stella-maris TaxID=1810926 RepID=UPI003CCCE4BF
MDTGDYEGDVTIELHEIDPTGDSYNVFSTTVPATEEYTYLPERALPSLEAGVTTVLDLWVYTMSDDGWAWGSIVTGISMYDTRPATVTFTTTLSETTTHAISTTAHWSGATPMATASPTDDAVDITSDNGLSTGAKAGIGVGAAIGALILLAAAFFFFRRWQKQRAPPKTIREISAGENTSSSVAFINGLPSDNGSGSGSGAHTEAFGHGSVISAPSENGDKGFRGVSLPAVVSPIEEDRSVSGRRDGERFELGG